MNSIVVWIFSNIGTDIWHTVTHYIPRTRSVSIFKLAFSKTKRSYIIITYILNSNRLKTKSVNITYFRNSLKIISQEVTLHIRCNNTPLGTVHQYTAEPVTI